MTTPTLKGAADLTVTKPCGANAEVQELALPRQLGEPFCPLGKAMPMEGLHQGSGTHRMHLNDEAKRWLKENGHKLSKQPETRKRRSRAEQARRMKEKFLAHPKAQYYMTFQDFRDQAKRDAICGQYGLDLIRF